MSIPNVKYLRYEEVQNKYFYGLTNNDSCTRYELNGTPVENFERTSANRQRPKPNPLIPTPLVYREVFEGPSDTVECMQHVLRTANKAQGNWLNCHNGGSIGPYITGDSAGDVPMAQALALSRMTGEFASLGESFLELKRTAKMIGNRASQIANLAAKLRSGDWSSLSRSLKGDVPSSVRNLPSHRRLSDGWLELQFGWLPLVSDAYGIAEVYRNQLVKGAPVKRSGNSVQGGFGQFRPQDGSGQKYLKGLANRNPNAKSTMYATVGNPTIATLNQLGLINPAALAWDLLPYSFVVDWFIPISPILQSLSGRAGLNNVYFCNTSESYGYRDKRHATCHPFVQNLTRTVTRTVTSSSPLPTRANPRNHGIWHLTTAVALLSQRFGRR